MVTGSSGVNTANQGQRNSQYTTNNSSSGMHTVSGGLLVENTEKIQGELKNSIVKNVFMGDGWVSNRNFFTEKRFYHKSKSLMGHKEDFVVDLKDISATEIKYRNPIGLLVVAVLLLIMFIVQLTKESGDIKVLLFIVFFVILYFLFRCTVLKISFSGGSKSMLLRMYSYHDVENFHKKLRYMKTR